MTQVQRYLRYSLDRGVGEANIPQNHFIDLAADLSYVNSRLYRQGREYFVKSIKVMSTNTPTGYVEVATLPCSWPVFAAYKKARGLWNKMNSKALADAGLTKKHIARWHDFKVYMQNDMRLSGALLKPVDSNENQGNYGGGEEWEYSKYVSTDGTLNDEFDVHMLGGHLGTEGSLISASIMHGFEETRIQPDEDSPDLDPAFDTSWMSNLFDVQGAVDDVIANMDEFNDAPPYHPTQIVGASTLPQPLTVGWTSLNNTKSQGFIGGFCAPLGLLKITHMSSEDDDSIHIIVELQQGKYKGVRADAI